MLFVIQLSAQPTYEQRIEDSVIGWWYKSTIDKPKPYQYMGRDFSLKQQEMMNTVTEWMKKTYIPVAGVGTFRRMIFANSYSNPPHAYGVDFRVWNVDLDKHWLDEKGFCKPVSEEYTKFYFNANSIPGGTPISFVNTPTQYLFAWMIDGYAGSDQVRLKRITEGADPRIHPNVYKYVTCINEIHSVFLVPGNKLPFTPISKGEYLNIVEAAIDRDKQYDQTQHDRCKSAIKKLREQYKNSLQEHAVLEHMQPSILDYDGSSDPFLLHNNTRELKHYYPVYKLETTVIEKCKSDQPQWITISFPFKTKEDGNQLYEMYKAMTENFNYDYAYNFFFDPEKVKGVVYKPVNEAERDARLDVYRKRAYWKSPNEGKTQATNIHFMDDFSSNAEGSKPAGWYFRSVGEHTRVSIIKNLTGKWAELGFGNNFSPNTSLKKPLPENFSFEFDAATDDFNSRTGGALELQLSSYPVNIDGRENQNGDGIRITLRLTSGNEADYNNNNYRGLATITINGKSGVNTQNNLEGISYEYELREFTNKKNKVHIMVRVKNGEVGLSINNKSVAASKDFKMGYGKPCIQCSLPAGTLFRNLYFRNITNDWGVEGKSDGVDVYISNIKITKD